MNETRPPQETPTRPLTIGAFAREAHLTPRALRLYDALGLLAPALTDPASGYRLYTPGQLPRARLIALLRQLGMPLTRIAAVLDLPGPEAARSVGAYWREVERDAQAKRRLVHHLGTFLSGKGDTMYDVHVREVPEGKVLTRQRHLLVGELPGFIDAACRDLFGAIAASGLRAGPRSLVIYHGRVDEENDGPVEVCVPFEGGPLDPQGDLRVRLEPAHRDAYTTITKAQCEFPGILEAYDAVFGHVREQGWRAAASPREVYFVPESAVGADDPFCDIAFPFREGEADSGG